jgi:membrane fusion protein (multidrug efflux system)
VEAAQAAVEAAQVNLGFTHLASPIDGVVGQAQVQVGNLVGPSSGVITTVSTLDPIKANFTVGEQEYLNLTRGGKELSKLQLELILADGSTYSHKGKFSFADRQVNQSTGAIQLTGLFPNPGNTLRPGQYGRVRAAIGTSTGALLVPQRAVSELQGTYQVAVLDDANKVHVEVVNVGDQGRPEARPARGRRGRTKGRSGQNSEPEAIHPGNGESGEVTRCQSFS